MAHYGPGSPKKKPSLRVDVIDFEFFGFDVSIWVPWSPLLVPESHDTLVEVCFVVTSLTVYVECNLKC